MDLITKTLASELSIPAEYVQNVIDLMDEGNTIPFIARYRKEAHGAQNDETLRNLEERLKALRNLEARKEEILRSVEGQGKLTKELEKAVREAKTLSEAEDIYRPYKQKKRTRAIIAKEKGLEPLAELLFSQNAEMKAPLLEAEKYIDPEKGVESAEDALKGARDIIAEMISDNADVRKVLRSYTKRTGVLTAKAAKKEEEASVYDGYYGFAGALDKLKGHQILALNRGEKEGFLKVSLETDREDSTRLLSKMVVKGTSPAEETLREASADSYTRLIQPSIENELRSALFDEAAEGAIHNFALNLKPLLMQPPVKGKVTMGLDPGYRMGCKVAVVDPTGKVLDTTVVYPTYGERQQKEAIAALSRLIEKHRVERIAIGNGTASRETEIMAAELIRPYKNVSYMVVSEAGASVYSASKLASEEFPEYDVNLRSAVSIARRLQDPLAELVKIDPKAIGVGQYQHDMPEARLDEALSAVVEDCVNSVGVDLNTASPSLLKHVSGLSLAAAKNIVGYREENGAFKSRRQILKVPKIGAKTFEQCAGFLRVPESENIFDNTGVHPESEEAAKALLSLMGFTPEDVKAGEISALPEKVKKYGTEKAASQIGVGVPTMEDIIGELLKPGRDPREELPQPIFRKDLLDISDLKPGMELTGTVRNVIDFGAFVDIGVHQDGLVHISEICDRYIKHPSEVVSVGDEVKVLVLSVDEKKKRIALSMRKAGK